MVGNNIGVVTALFNWLTTITAYYVYVYVFIMCSIAIFNFIGFLHDYRISSDLEFAGRHSIIWRPITRSIPRDRPSHPEYNTNRPYRAGRTDGRTDVVERAVSAADCCAAPSPPMYWDLCVLCHFYRTRRQRGLMVAESISGREWARRSGTQRRVDASPTRDSYRRCCLMQPSIDEPLA